MKPNTIRKSLIITLLSTTFAITSVMAQGRAGYVDLTYAAENSVNAVTYIKTEFVQKNSAWDEFFSGSFWENFFGMAPSHYPLQAAGSGVIVSPDGYILTNNHVVEDAVKITITLYDKREYSGKVIGTDPKSDLALIKIEESGLPYLKFANSDSVKLGEWVLAVGNPLSLHTTVTAGIISAKARQLSLSRYRDSEESYLQTDAAINPGNSGGALVNAQGKLIGINTAIASGDGYFTGYSFAIPSNIAKKVYFDLKEYGKMQKAYLGLSMMEVTAEVAQEYSLPTTNGIYVASVEEEGAAKQNGLEEGDVILSIENTPVNSFSEVLGVLNTKSPGDRVKVTFQRNGVEKTQTITLLNENGTTDIIKD
ncbi:MAG: trypsin-like peptidase domain-containing protein [Bacteroidales bacterium]|nr:trypsin-like peptidase domain-containing protein [Bacteroidales bacterium]